MIPSSLCSHYALSSSKWTTISVFQYHVKSTKIWPIEHFAHSYISLFKVIHLASVQCDVRADRILNIIWTLQLTTEYCWNIFMHKCVWTWLHQLLCFWGINIIVYWHDSLRWISCFVEPHHDTVKHLWFTWVSPEKCQWWFFKIGECCLPHLFHVTILQVIW